jgi:hypothetical protein
LGICNGIAVAPEDVQLNPTALAAGTVNTQHKSKMIYTYWIFRRAGDY